MSSWVSVVWNVITPPLAVSAPKVTPKTMSAALVHTTGKTSSDLLAILERPDLPAEVAEKTALGALKKLKGSGFVSLSTAVGSDDKAKLALVEKLGLAKAGAGGDKIISFVANLASMNPDPRMKMK